MGYPKSPFVRFIFHHVTKIKYPRGNGYSEGFSTYQKIVENITFSENSTSIA